MPASGGRRLPIDEVAVEDFDRMFEVHVRGTFFATQAVVPGMTEREYGRIVNISSIYAMGGSPRASHYAAAKAAISGFTKCWAQGARAAPDHGERGRSRFRRNRHDAAAPTATSRSPSANRGMPLGRFTRPEDISYAVAWLASDETEMITGQVVSPNAGETIVGI